MERSKTRADWVKYHQGFSFSDHLNGQELSFLKNLHLFEYFLLIIISFLIHFYNYILLFQSILINQFILFHLFFFSTIYLYQFSFIFNPHFIYFFIDFLLTTTSYNTYAYMLTLNLKFYHNIYPWGLHQGILKGEASLYCWPPVWRRHLKIIDCLRPALFAY